MRLDLFIQIPLGVVLHLYAVVAAGGIKLLEDAVVLIVGGLFSMGRTNLVTLDYLTEI